ncbi:MAG: hypothetical protein ACX94A_11210, partial [Algiphilus sp.]
MPRSQTTLMEAREAAHPEMAVSEIAQLTGSEAFQSLDALVGAIYDGALSTPPWKEAMGMVQERLAAEHVTLMLRPPSAENSGVMINTGETSQQATESYATR